jgi:hypothetical protein
MLTHILTAQVPEDIAAWVDGVEEERYRLTKEAMRDVRAGNYISHESVLLIIPQCQTPPPTAAAPSA